jgi:hypothetical protein
MRALAVVLPLALSTGVFGQVHRSFGSVVFPGGATNPAAGVVRNFGSTVFPGGAQVAPVFGGAPIVGARPFVGGVNAGGINVGRGNFLPIVNGNRSNIRRNPNNNFNNGRGFRSNSNVTPFVFAYPVFVGGGYDSSYDPNAYGPSGYGPSGYGPQDMLPPQQPQQPNVTVVFPPQQQQPPQQPNPVMIQAGPDGQYTTSGQRPGSGATIYDAPQGDTAQGPAEPSTDAPRFLLAFKDRTIYSVIAYWTDGDTLHYFTSGNVHNQASISLIDRELTERLNRELGIDFKLPAAK